MAEGVDAATAFFRDVPDFRLTEQIMANDGYQLATWLERSHTDTLALIFPADWNLSTSPGEL